MTQDKSFRRTGVVCTTLLLLTALPALTQPLKCLPYHANGIYD